MDVLADLDDLDGLIPLVVTEGNCPLHDEGPGRRSVRSWTRCGSWTPTPWCAYAGSSTGMRFGRERPHAERGVRDPDEANARLVARGPDRADLVVGAGD